FKMCSCGLRELLSGSAGGGELGQQGGELEAHRVLDHAWLTQLLGAEDRAQSLDIGLDVAAATGLDQQAAQLRSGQLARGGWGGCGGQDSAGVGAGQAAVVELGEGLDRGGEEFLEQR